MKLLSPTESKRLNEVMGFVFLAFGLLVLFSLALAARQADWLNILLADATSARTLMNVRVAHDAPLPAPFDASSILESARTGLPTVSKVAVGSMKRLAFAVRVPVTVDGRIKYVLSVSNDTATTDDEEDAEVA